MNPLAQTENAEFVRCFFARQEEIFSLCGRQSEIQCCEKKATNAVFEVVSTSSKFVVGLTGGIGSGKTTISKLFADKGICIADADIASRTVVACGSSALQQISSHFGEDILLNGELNRSRLKEIIFANPVAKKWLEELLHPLIREELIKTIAQSTSKYTILSSPLLFETHQNLLTNRVLVINYDEATQAQRVSLRDNISVELALKIIKSQMSNQARIDLADDIIDNTQDLAYLQKQVDLFDLKYRDLAE
jgi:dephospho-CoA kinase